MHSSVSALREGVSVGVCVPLTFAFPRAKEPHHYVTVYVCIPLRFPTRLASSTTTTTTTTTVHYIISSQCNSFFTSTSEKQLASQLASNKLVAH